MKTKRAKRLAKFLDEIGWQVFSNRQECRNCDHISYIGKAKFCAMCGEEMPPQKPENECLSELEKAIAYALEEK